ncbi:cell division protein FtsL [Anaerovibrio sp.]|uniref:cell division protein FtsL n=1 Tax=Anaerovibrio sp. TaxID=1872532 RepID=UPI0025BC77AB|nr:cell division protein FtsL [Anaerovibrio sp.]MBR2143016.1 cell division protein FtsL [Anaerovibrio sp.]
MSVVKHKFEKNQRRQINWFVIIMIIMFLLAAFKLGEQAITYRDLSQERIKAEERLKAAQEENDRLNQEKEQLNDPEYIEKLAREELGMTKNGEIPYVYSKNK